MTTVACTDFEMSLSSERQAQRGSSGLQMMLLPGVASRPYGTGSRLATISAMLRGYSSQSGAGVCHRCAAAGTSSLIIHHGSGLPWLTAAAGHATTRHPAQHYTGVALIQPGQDRRRELNQLVLLVLNHVDL